MTNERRAIVQMLLCAVFWSLSGVLTKLVNWHPLAISSGRSVLAALVLFLYIKKRRLPLIFNKRTALLGVCVVIIFLLYMPAVKLTTAANAIVLQYTAPIYVLLYSVLVLKQHAKRGDLIAVTLTFAGIALCFIDQLGGGSLAGNLLALGSGVFLGGMFIIGGLVSEEERLSGLFFAQLLAVITGAPFLFSAENVISTQAVLLVALQGVVQLGLPYILYTRATRYCPPLKCSLISVIEPLVNPIWVFLAVGERPGQYAFFGIAVVLVTITIWCIWQEKQKQLEEAAVETVTE